MSRRTAASVALLGFILASAPAPGRGQSSGLPATSTLLTASPSPSRDGESVTLTARVSLVTGGTTLPSGTVEFFDVDTSLGQATLAADPNGGVSATLDVSWLRPGMHPLTASYGGDASCSNSSSAPVLHMVVAQ